MIFIFITHVNSRRVEWIVTKYSWIFTNPHLGSIRRTPVYYETGVFTELNIIVKRDYYHILK